MFMVLFFSRASLTAKWIKVIVMLEQGLAPVRNGFSRPTTGHQFFVILPRAEGTLVAGVMGSAQHNTMHRVPHRFRLLLFEQTHDLTKAYQCFEVQLY